MSLRKRSNLIAKSKFFIQIIREYRHVIYLPPEKIQKVPRKIMFPSRIIQLATGRLKVLTRTRSLKVQLVKPTRNPRASARISISLNSDKILQTTLDSMTSAVEELNSLIFKRL